MRLVFIGASRFGLRCLNAVRALPAIEIGGVVTAPATFAISYRPSGVTNVLHADVAEYCAHNGIPCTTITNGMRDAALFTTVEGWRPDAFLVVGWYHMVPRKWRDLAPAYGLHASLLPDYSGGAPLVWAIINGEPRTGISFFRFENGVDNGPIVGQAATDIGSLDTIATLYNRIEKLGLGLLQTHLPKLADGTATLTSQDESRRRQYPQRAPEDGLIDWSLSAPKIYDFVRAQTRPYPGAFFMLEGHKWTVWATRQVEFPAVAAGQFVLKDKALIAGCGKGSIELTELARDDRDVPIIEAAAQLAGNEV